MRREARNERRARGGGGFTLIEVNLAVMAIAVGLLVLFNLFPAGLRESEAAAVDTRVAFFVDGVFSGIQANAAQIRDWNRWNNMTTFAADATRLLFAVPTATPIQVEYPIGSGNYVWYKMSITGSATWPASRKRTVTLEVSGEKRVFANPAWFGMSVYYQGM